MRTPPHGLTVLSIVRLGAHLLAPAVSAVSGALVAALCLADYEQADKRGDRAQKRERAQNEDYSGAHGTHRSITALSTWAAFVL